MTVHRPLSTDAELRQWHAMPANEVLSAFETVSEGLSADEAKARLERYGLNRLNPPRRTLAIVRFLLQFHNVLIYVLIAAAGVTALLGHWIDTGVILAVVIINGAIGYLQEGKAERALDAIRNMLSPEATVVRSGMRQTIEAEQLVPGDVVFLESGDKVSADLRLFRVRDLRIEEAVLTGESVPTEKRVEPVDENAGAGDRLCMAFSGTLVAAGQGFGVVVGTSTNTEIGRISVMISEVETLTTPLLEQVSRFGRVLAITIVLIATGVFAYGTWVGGGNVGEMFLAAVGLAVAAIPEGLPAILSITLAIGVQRMAARHAIIRRLPAVDTLGSVTVICSDKTGTLTRNEMTVQVISTSTSQYQVSGVGYAPEGGFKDAVSDKEVFAPDDVLLSEVLRCGLLCNDASVVKIGRDWVSHGDPTEIALVTAAMKGELDTQTEHSHWPRVDILPFESDHRFMATLHHSHATDQVDSVMFLKGAPERFIDMCTHERFHGETDDGATESACAKRPLDREKWQQRSEELASKGMRVLAVACKQMSCDKRDVRFEDVEQGEGLTLLALIGMIDPPREEAIVAVSQCRTAGIRVKMITGDHALTAMAIGKQLGIGNREHVMTGSELDKLNPAQLCVAAREVDIFARVSPAHKLRLVEAMQADGHIVSMTGDGVNDAPALKRANVGVAMGHKGTEAAKEAADMVLGDDNFASIAHAVEEGRTVYDNLRKAILFILPTNGGQALVIAGAIFLGRELPITPVQILWVNMVTAVTLALALAFEPPEAEVMIRPPRKPGTALLDRFFIWRITFVSILLWIGTFGLFLWARNAGYDAAFSRTLAVNALVIMEVFYLFNTRSLTAPILNLQGILGNRMVLLAISVVLMLQLLYTYLPMSQRLFDTASLSISHWLMILPLGMAVLLLVELEKWFLRRFKAKHLTPSAP